MPSLHLPTPSPRRGQRVGVCLPGCRALAFEGTGEGE